MHDIHAPSDSTLGRPPMTPALRRHGSRANLLAMVPQLAASTGSACHAGEHAPNATLLAMGIAPELTLGAVRLSLGRITTPAEVTTAAELLAGAHRALCSTTPSPTNASKGSNR